ncbi:MAG TPA: ABC transporter ATP-binding protein [Hyphomicrobiaceae bacterium]|nr:ABC transporter ATP-binding protein [Hyphomicrobiaceae bacterium]
MSDTPILETRNLFRSFGGLQAVRDVSIELRAGELHAVIGPNGAGKSTLVNLLAGELRPTAGHILLDGHEITGTPNWKMTAAGVARSFQRTNVFLPLTVHDNVRLAAQAHAYSLRAMFRSAKAATELDDRTMACLARVGLTDAADRIAGELSHGEQRQLEIAMALASEPKVLLLDEPLAGMGQEEAGRMAKLLDALTRDHGVLLIEHDMDFVFQVAHRLTVLVEGSVLATGKPADVRENKAVQAAYLGGHA